MLKALVSLQSRVNSLKSEDGNAAEYGLIVGLVSVVIIGALIALGLALSGVFADVTAGLNNAPAPVAP
jgi:Flp pilus assembly pilin Flp